MVKNKYFNIFFESYMLCVMTSYAFGIPRSLWYNRWSLNRIIRFLRMNCFYFFSFIISICLSRNLWVYSIISQLPFRSFSTERKSSNRFRESPGLQRVQNHSYLFFTNVYGASTITFINISMKLADVLVV